MLTFLKKKNTEEMSVSPQLGIQCAYADYVTVWTPHRIISCTVYGTFLKPINYFSIISNVAVFLCK